jgi:hypothetical protein
MLHVSFNGGLCTVFAVVEGNTGQDGAHLLPPCCVQSSLGAEVCMPFGFEVAVHALDAQCWRTHDSVLSDCMVARQQCAKSVSCA